MDGARFANAVAALGVSPHDLTLACGVDVLSFGGTKNGAMLAEAVIFFNPDLARDFTYTRKRLGQLASKGRYISAQFIALWQDDLWLELAAHSNHMAKLLSEGLTKITGFKLHYAVEANEVFIDLPDKVAAHLKARGHSFYAWPNIGPQAYRMVTNFSTPLEDIQGLIADAKSLATS